MNSTIDSTAASTIDFIMGSSVNSTMDSIVESAVGTAVNLKTNSVVDSTLPQCPSEPMPHNTECGLWESCEELCEAMSEPSTQIVYCITEDSPVGCTVSSIVNFTEVPGFPRERWGPSAVVHSRVTVGSTA